MKTSFKKQRSIFLTLMAIVALYSCSNEEVAMEDPTAATLDQELTARDAQIDIATDEVNSIVETVYFNDELESTDPASRSGMSPSNFLPDCVTITTVVTATTREKTIDFGDGCELPNGNVLSGIIYMSYAKDMEAATKTISVSFENFFVNEINIAGSMSRLRQRANDANNPQSTINVDITVTWPDQSFASRLGTKVREWVAGVGSGTWGDNVYLITGSWTSTFRNGTVHSGEVVEPLRRELACLFLVSGTIDLQRNDATATLDFGDGSCDNTASLTLSNGEVLEITL
ncbi:hypothetical protein ACFQ1M_10885 [Sungkyunkwania multivorans]|uniref:Lipoprotein n=1 Tax=Sungkyunkwania multivorans TaxID=1173618 RepID=A0ABW3CY37_9FLAO